MNDFHAKSEDLLVAKGTESGVGDDAVITSGLAWDHVATGYSAELESKLSVNNDTIQLTSHAGAELGAVKIASDNLTVSTVAVDNKININLEWGTWDEE